MSMLRAVKNDARASKTMRDAKTIHALKTLDVGTNRQLKMPFVPQISSGFKRGKNFTEDVVAGYIYGVSGSNLIKGKSDGTGLDTTIWTKDASESYFGNEFSYRFPNGRLLTTVHVSGVEARVYVSDLAEDTEKVFTKTLTAEGYPYSYWAWDVYGDIVLFGTYEPIDSVTYKNRYVHMSLDQGLTWKTIFDRRAVGGSAGQENHAMHIHGVNYDPFTGDIWVATGDFSWRGLYYSTDQGNTWNSVYDASTPYVNYQQWMCIGFTEDYVVLGTDAYPNGIAVMPRAKPFLPENVEYRWIDFAPTVTAYSLPHSFIYGDNGDLYCVTTNLSLDFNPVILGSPNGYDWYVLYRHSGVLTAENAGFTRFYRAGDYLCGFLKDDVGTTLVKVKIPTWSI